MVLKCRHKVRHIFVCKLLEGRFPEHENGSKHDSESHFGL